MDSKLIGQALEALLEHLDSREGESLRTLGTPKTVEVTVEAEGEEECPLCATGEPHEAHADKGGGLAAKLAALTE